MRFQRLQIPAFGPFTHLDLRFPALPGDLHVVYGANEAGKSSLLRAIRDLLFGIHGQSSDDFLHDYGELRIKGEILNRAGSRLVFQRRKGNKNTLLNEEGTQLSDDVLAPFLGVVDQPHFSTMFGLGASELHAGAQELLRGQGSIGDTLFSASLGGTPVQTIIRELQEEADRLFKGRATANVSIRPAVNRYKDLLKQSREAVVNPETWERLEEELAEAEASGRILEEAIAQRARDLQWISRCEDALPTVGTLEEESQKHARLPPLPDLAGDFPARAKAARRGASEAQAELQRLASHVGKFRIQLAGCQIAPAVLAEAGALDQLHQDLGAYRERKKSLAGLKATLTGLEPLVRAGMNNLQIAGGLESLASHRLATPVRFACEEAADALKRAQDEQASNSSKGEALELRITTQETQLQSLPETDLGPLREALAVAAGATEADRTFPSGESEVQRLSRETTDQHRQLSGAPPDFEATALLPVPSHATRRAFQQRMEENRHALKAETEAIRDASKQIKATQTELGRLQRQGELPSEQALQRARAHRDHGWNLVLGDWKGGGVGEAFVPGSPLEEAFPEAIRKADEIADRLRLHADAVAQAEEKRSRLTELESEIGAAQTRIVELTVGSEECQKAWYAEWSASAITPRAPAEMEGWLDLWNEFRSRLGKLKTSEESLEQKRRQIAHATQRLAGVLGGTEEKEFSSLFAAARKRVQDGEQDAGRRIEVANQLEASKAERARFEQRRSGLADAVATATAKWRSQCAAVSLAENTSPDAGLAILRERKDLLLKFDEWRVATDKEESLAGEIAVHEQAVRGKANALGVHGETTEALDAALWKALAEARKAQDRHDELARQIDQTEGELSDARTLANQADQTLEGLLRLAGLTTVAELEPLLAHFEQRLAVQARIDNLRHTLGGLARGQLVDEFVARVRSESPDALAERKSTATREKLEREAALTALRETLFRLRNERKLLEKAADAAADYRQQAESCAAKLRQDAARHLRLRLATHLLGSQIERFRKENQGPLLQKSGEVFQAITRRAFTGLGADFNADDLPVLVGVRPDQSRVPVKGLSDGTRDQLYLALRLAALDRYLEQHEPMPFILDDLLITFDDDRARAILPQLDALAQRTQIFLFTHHEHLVELCRRTLGEGRFHLHRLGHAG